MYGADHLSLVPLMLTSGKYRMSHEAQLQPRELGTLSSW